MPLISGEVRPVSLPLKHLPIKPPRETLVENLYLSSEDDYDGDRPQEL